MKAYFKSAYIVFIGVLTLISLTQCTTSDIKLTPEYEGVDPRVSQLVNEYKELAKIQGITFKKDVTIGFKKINDKSIIGLTTYGLGWREIDLDSDYWYDYKTSSMSRMVLVFHELSHAYCDRCHDYGKDGDKYLETEEERIKQAKEWIGLPPGRYINDACPLSLMYPTVLTDDCTLAHYNDYIQEMFLRCKPW